VNTQEFSEVPPKIIRLAEFFGLIKQGYTLEDYLVQAVKTGGYETVDIWGPQGVGKSERMLQMLYWIYGDWDAVIDSLVFKPASLVTILEEIPDDERMPALGWDDIGVHYPSSTFKTDIKQYQAIDSTWAAIRTKCNVVVTTIPLIDRLAKNIKDNVTFEVFIGRNQMEIVYRVFHLPGQRSIESNFFKIVVEQPRRFDLFNMPLDDWKRYWKKRLELTREALATLKGATDMESLDGYIPVIEAAKIASEQKIHYATSTIQQDISRGILRGQRINGRLCVSEDDYYENLVLKGGVRPI